MESYKGWQLLHLLWCQTIQLQELSETLALK
jgi:hypothetical protein